MRIEVKANEIRPGDMIWFSGDRKPSEVTSARVQEGAEKLVVLDATHMTWYLNYKTGNVFKFVPDDEPVDAEERVFLDPQGNPT